MLEPNASTKHPSNAAGTDWATHEFAHAPLPDQRLVQRLITLATDFAQHPTAPIPQACGAWSKTKAAWLTARATFMTSFNKPWPPGRSGGAPAGARPA
jgi:chitodextrinase